VSLQPAIARCLGTRVAGVATIESVAQWLPIWREVAAAQPGAFDRAVAGGFAADRVGWAFASGYQAALRALVPGLLADGAVAALCVTEEGGNRPRDIATTISERPEGGFTLTGAKRWTTLGPDSTLLLVAGRVAGSPAERPVLRVALVPAATPGLTLDPMAPTRFVPEVPHARVRLDGVRLPAEALLPGDGYDAYVKPFRTIEDVHVTLAVLAYLLREARARGWPAAFAERAVAAMELLCVLSDAAPDAPPTHLALAGALQFAQAAYADAGTLWSQQPDDPAAQRWARDAALFAVASSVRARRAERAWERLRGG
jgi:alkylation response protein AidB-like acyl-CoA dehydrogenase